MVKMMAEKNVCILIYPTHQATEGALTDLQKAGVDLQRVSVVGKGYQGAQQAIGFYNLDNHVCYRGAQSTFWAGLWGLLTGAVFFWLPGFGPLVAAGPVSDFLVRSHDGTLMDGGFGVLGAALFELGVPRGSIADYEQAVTAEQLLLIVYGGLDLVESACRILHGEEQQVTVHRA